MGKVAGDRDAGRLVVCSTPIGNLGDVTERVLAALREADVVCAEDTRVTGRLLAAYDIDKRLERLDEALIGARTDGIIDRVRAGEVIAYCTDAGMPGVSDPGLRLVAAARAAGVDVEVLPGASAATTAYVASGCPNARYYFGGFLPRKEGERRALLDVLRGLDAALIFYESPNRVLASLESIAEAFPLREAAMCRELTKVHEEVLCGTTQQVRDEVRARVEAAASGVVKGEIVLVIDGPNDREAAGAAAEARALAEVRAADLVAQGMSTKDAAASLVDDFGLARNEAYDLVMEIARNTASKRDALR